MSLKPNPGCDDYRCLRRQKEYQDYVKANPLPEPPKKEEVVISQENEWGISVVDETDPQLLATDDLVVTQGIKIAYTIPETALKLQEGDSQVNVDDTTSLDDLMGQMKNL